MKKSDEVPRPASCPALPQQQTSSKSQRPLSALEAEWRNRGHGCNSFYTSSLKPLQNIPTSLESERKQPEETTNSVVPPLLALSRTSNTSGESSLWPSSSSNPSSVNPPDFQKLKTRKISFGPRTLYGSSAQSHLFEDKKKGEDHNMTSGNSAVTLPGTQAETDGQLTKDMNTQAGPSMLDPSQKLPKRMSCFLDTENQQPAPKTVRIAPFNRLSNEPPKMSVIDGDKTTICLPHPVSASSVPPAEYPPGTKMSISDGGFVACIPMPGGGKFSPHRLAAHRTNCGCHAHIRAQKILASKDSNEGTKTQPVVIDSDDELEIVMDVPANASSQTKGDGYYPRIIDDISPWNCYPLDECVEQNPFHRRVLKSAAVHHYSQGYC